MTKFWENGFYLTCLIIFIYIWSKNTLSGHIEGILECRILYWSYFISYYCIIIETISRDANSNFKILNLCGSFEK